MTCNVQPTIRRIIERNCDKTIYNDEYSSSAYQNVQINPLMNPVRHQVLPNSQQETVLYFRRNAANVKKLTSPDKMLSKHDFNKQRSQTTTSAQAGAQQTTTVIEDNHRVSRKLSAFHEEKKPFYNLNASQTPVLDYSRPDYMILPEAKCETNNRLMYSRVSGWVTVDEANGLIRKHAPETEMG